MDQKRVEFLDGLRGWAALIVLFYHTFIGVLPPLLDSEAYRYTWWPITGRFSVCLFFLVSGFALSIVFMRNQNKQAVVRMAAGRYFRLLIPIFVVCALVSISMNTGLFPEPNERPSSKVAKFAIDPTLPHLFQFSFYEVFFNYIPKETYAGPLWTMSIELYGSFIVAIALLILGKPRNHLVIYLLATVFLLYFKSYYFLFLVGMLACDYQKELYKIRLKFLPPLMLVAGFMIPVMLRPNKYALLCGAVLFFIGVIISPQSKTFMSTKCSRFLGTISFPLYLIHAPILYVVGMPLYMAHQDSIGIKILAGFIGIIVAIIAAILLIPVNTLAMNISRFVGRNFVRLVYPKQ